MSIIPGVQTSEAINCYDGNGDAALAANIVVTSAKVSLHGVGTLSPNATAVTDGICYVIYTVPIGTPVGTGVDVEVTIEVDGIERQLTQDVGHVGESLEDVRESLQRIEDAFDNGTVIPTGGNIVDQINAIGTQADDALLAGEFEKAKMLGLILLRKLSSVPDGKKEGEAGAELSWDRAAVQQFIKQVGDLEFQCMPQEIKVVPIRFDMGKCSDC